MGLVRSSLETTEKQTKKKNSLFDILEREKKTQTANK